MTTSRLSIFAKPTHGNAWLNYHGALQPFDILLLDPDVQQVSDAHKASPESEITIRRWDWDDGRTQQNPHGVYLALRNDPRGLAVQHISQYSALISEWEREAKSRGIPFPPREKLSVHLVNEPDSNSLLPQVNLYTVDAALGLAGFGLKVDGLNLSTGHPAILKQGQPDWSPLLEALDALAHTGSYAVVHEYFNSTGITNPDLNPWHVLRHHWMPRKAKIKIGEFGLDEILNGVMNQHHGWIDRITTERMLESVEWYMNHIRDDVVGVRIYMTDFVDRLWRTFNTEPIHAELIQIGRKFLSSPGSYPGGDPAVTTHLPVVSSGPIPATPTAIVSVEAGANLRTGPGLNYSIVEAVPKGIQLDVIGRNHDGTWFKVDMNSGQPWVSATVVNAFNVGDVPIVDAPNASSTPDASQPKGILDPITALAFLQVESGNRPFTDGLLTIRFEVHVFKNQLGNNELFDKHFRFVPGNYGEQYWRADPDGQWQNAHGPMAERHKLLSFARRMNDTAALKSTGMGLGQIMGLNYARVGFKSPQAMFNAFSNQKFGANAQLIAFFNYMLSDNELFEALQKRDWYTAVQKYNGTGQEQLYIGYLNNALNQIQGAIGG